MTLSITLCIGCYYAECRDLCIAMPNVIMLSAIMLSAIILSVIMLSVVMLNVLAPSLSSKLLLEGTASCIFR